MEYSSERTPMLSTSLTLLGRLRLNADETSWKNFVDLYAPLLCRWNVAAGLQPADAQEIAQEVLLTVFQKVASFERGHVGSFRAWLRSITANKIRELHRRQRRRRETSAANASLTIDSVPDPGANFAWGERYAEDLFLQACELVRPRINSATWQMFVAVYFDRQPVETIARRHGVSRNAVYIAQCRCLAKVRGVIEGYLDDSLQAPVPGECKGTTSDSDVG